MLGWEIIISRQAPNTSGEQGNGARARLASWEVTLGGLNWIDALVEQGKAVLVATNQGYPVQYTAVASAVLAALANGPPPYGGPEVFSVQGFRPSGWIGNVHIDRAALEACAPDEQLLIDAWDLD